MRKINFIILLGLGVTIISCEKESKKGSTQGPSLSNSPFTCFVDGQPWVAETPPSIGGPSPYQAEYDLETGSISITATRKLNEPTTLQTIYFYCPDVRAEGEYQLFTSQGELQAFVDYHSDVCGFYYHDPENPGILKITEFDTIQQMIYGEVSFTAKNPNCTSAPYKTITTGKFKVGY